MLLQNNYNYDIVNKGTNNVKISAQIDHGQTISTVIHLNGKKVSDHIGNFTYTIGKEKEILGKKLLVVIIASDIQSNTNRLKLELYLEGGKKKIEEVILDQDVKANSSVVSINNITFY